MFRLLNYIFEKVSQKTSYTIAVAFTASISAAITLFFIFYYLNAVNFPFHLISLKALIITVSVGIILHAYQFDGFRPLGLRSFSRSVNILNEYCILKPVLQVRKNLTDEQLISLWNSVNFIGILNSLTAAFWIIVPLFVLTAIQFLDGSFDEIDFFIYAITALISIFIHAGFSYIFSDIATGTLRKVCYGELFQRGIKPKPKYILSIKGKLTFTLLIFAIALLVSNSLTFYRRDDMAAVIVFSAVAVMVCFLMASLVFKSVDYSIQDIASAVLKLEQGNSAVIAPRFNDKNLLTVADKMNHVMAEILDYQQNLEKKVLERTRIMRQINAQLSEKERHLMLELQFAGDIQKGIYPNEYYQWHDLEIASFYKAMHIVSGDYLDIFLVKNNRLAVLLTDASGHGVPAALITMMAKVAFHGAALRHYKPSSIFQRVNFELAKLIQTQDYMTAFLLTFEEDGSFLYSNAAHINAIVYRKNTSTLEYLDTDGAILGVFEQNVPFGEASSKLEQGDRLVLFSDGILDSQNQRGEKLTLEEFQRILLLHAHRDVASLKEAILSDLGEYIFEEKPHDDKSFMIVGR